MNYLPEAPDLVRHTQADTTWSTAQQQLVLQLHKLGFRPTKHPKTPTAEHAQKAISTPRSATPILRALYAALTETFPHVTLTEFVSFWRTLTKGQQSELSAEFFRTFTHHHQLHQQSRTAGYGFQLTAAISELIDLNRHRAWGRHTPLLHTPHVAELVRDGWVLPLYLSHPQLKALKEQYNTTLAAHYKALQAFAKMLPEEGFPLLLSLLPNAHCTTMYLSGGPRELSYLPQLRVRPGGHINYRALAYDLAQAAAKVEPALAGIALGTNKKPDPLSRVEFFDRS